VIVSAEEWARKTVRKGTLAEFLLASPQRGADLELGRQLDPASRSLQSICKDMNL
jgi:hypothetical protein